MPGLFDDVADTLFKGLLKGTLGATKIAGKAAYGAYNKSKEQAEIERLTRQTAIDDTGEFERQARAGNTEAQYQYGIHLYSYGAENDLDSIKDTGMYWIIKAANDGHKMAQCFLDSIGED